ncbi:MAG TPA: hypothetical protein VGB18_09510, partial [Candidatus Thermoplasmatota archaeon]
IPMVGAVPVDVDAPKIDSASADITLQADHSISANASANVHVAAGFGETMGVGFSGPSLEMSRSQNSGTISTYPTDQKVATAAVGTAVGVVALLALWSYLKYGALVGIGGPLFSRISSHKILDNNVRNRVHECIMATPGVTIKEVTQLLGIGWGTAVYHLGRLEQERLIVSERHRQFRRYFKNGGAIANDDKTGFSELKNPTTERIASEIANRPGTGQKDLCATVGISAPLAHKHLTRLESAQLLTKQREWRSVKYFPTEKLVALLAPAREHLVTPGTLVAQPVPVAA